MIKLRIDVDYPYTSRAKSFLYIALRIKSTRGNDYLRNARLIAQMINESPKDVRAYWFFTPYTIPDKRMLDLLNPQKHEVGLHVVNKPFEEFKTLEEKTNRKVQYYTIHGTEGRLNQLLWRPRNFKQLRLNQSRSAIPSNFKLISFHDEPPRTMSLDHERYLRGYVQVVKQIHDWIDQGVVMSMHPEWLFSARQKTQRGPFYDALKTMLEVDNDETLGIRKTAGVKICRDYNEYYKDVLPTDSFLAKLKLRDIDIFTFIERNWCCPIANPPSDWVKTEDNIALLEINDYETWWKDISKKTRNMVRKAEKDGVIVKVVPQNDELAKGIYGIYHETPIRQGRAFQHYNESLRNITENMYLEKNSTFISATIDGELAGFSQIRYGVNIAVLSNILSMQKYWDKSVNNALLAKAVEVCAAKGEHWLMYGRMSNHPSLDKFKENNGFAKYPITRYYIPLTSKGKYAIKLGLHRELKDALPDAIKYPLLPVVNWVSRTKAKTKLALKKA